METPTMIGQRIGRAIARDVIADDLPREWTRLDPQDGDQLLAAGYAADSADDWDDLNDVVRA